MDVEVLKSVELVVAVVVAARGDPKKIRFGKVDISSESFFCLIFKT